VMDAFSASTRALLNAAKSDAPQAAARAQMWGAVSSATGMAAAAAKGAAGTGVVGVTGAATAASGKLLVMGALLGSALTAGFGYALVHRATIEHRIDAVSASGDAKHDGVESAKNPSARNETESAAASARDTTGVTGHAPPLRKESSVEVSAPPLDIDLYSLEVSRKGVPDKGAAPGVAAPRVASAPVPRALKGDSLGREAALVAEASSAVRRGDAEAALASLDAVRRIGSHRMEPEELSIRVRALRSLGRDSEATETEATLRTKYPDHFLAR
jgi:hypothetical protein